MIKHTMIKEYKVGSTKLIWTESLMLGKIAEVTLIPVLKMNSTLNYLTSVNLRNIKVRLSQESV